MFFVISGKTDANSVADRQMLQADKAALVSWEPRNENFSIMLGGFIHCDKCLVIFSDYWTFYSVCRFWNRRVFVYDGKYRTRRQHRLQTWRSSLEEDAISILTSEENVVQFELLIYKLFIYHFHMLFNSGQDEFISFSSPEISFLPIQV